MTSRFVRPGVALALALSLGALIGLHAAAGASDHDPAAQVDARLSTAASVLEEIARELSLAFVSVHVPIDGPARLQSAFVVTADGDNSRIDFTSFGHRRDDDAAHESDQHEVGYYLADGRLMRRTQPWRGDPTAGGDEVALLRDVTGFHLDLLDSERLDWVDTWDAGVGRDQLRRLPLQVRVRVTLRRPDGRDGELTLGTRVRLPLHFALNHAVYRR